MQETGRHDDPMVCAHCGHMMNHHANKMLEDFEDSAAASPANMMQLFSCPECGTNASRRAI